MACLIDQVVVFDETGKGSVTCPSSFPEEPSDFSVSIDGQNLDYVGIPDFGFTTWAKGGTADNPVFPAVMFYNDLDGCWFDAAESKGTPIVGEHRISMCSSDSDDDSCPDVPFSESAPEKYADYFNEDGVFVPKESSGGGGDCPFDIINVSIIDETENVYAGDAVKIAHLVSAPFSGVVGTISGGNEELQAIAYNGKALLFTDSNSVTITLDPISNAQPAGSPGYLYITGDVSITIKDKAGNA